jgi:hypothetical protein
MSVLDHISVVDEPMGMVVVTLYFVLFHLPIVFDSAVGVTVAENFTKPRVY